METKELQGKLLDILKDKKEHITRDLINIIFPKEHLTAHIYSIIHYALDKLEEKGLIEWRYIEKERKKTPPRDENKNRKKIKTWKLNEN
jgi:hypothetical protein